MNALTPDLISAFSVDARTLSEGGDTDLEALHTQLDALWPLEPTSCRTLPARSIARSPPRTAG